MAKAKTRARKKGPAKKKPAKRKPARKRTTGSSQLLRIIAGFSILVLLVVLAGVLVHFLLQRSHPPRADRELSSPKMVSPFEIYPQEDHPPAATDKKPVPRAPGRRPKVALIIDDLGNDRRLARKFIRLDSNLTISILPQSPFIKHIAREALENNVEIMLHQPMEPNEYPNVNPGPGVLLSTMSPDEIIDQLNANLDAIPNIKGVNNHMGSKMTANAPQMRQIFSVLKRRGLYFVDSRTTRETKCRLSAGLLQVPFAERDVFIDHIDTSAFINRQLKELVRIAHKQGFAVGIAHPHLSTYEVLQKSLPDLKKKIEIVPASQIVKITS
jgi:polysaccharide deacetylase 2 family uncharacterized protein YibQ